MPFQTGLCGCTEDVNGCLDHCICLPCMIGRQCAALDGQVDSQNMMMCCCAFFTSSLLPAWACCIRKKLNETYSMDLSCIEWCCMGWVCPSCSLCQTHRELTLRQKWPGGSCCTKMPYNMN